MTETLPYSWYSDGSILEREHERLFAGRWQYAGHSGQLTEPGSYFTLRVAESRSWWSATGRASCAPS